MMPTPKQLQLVHQAARQVKLIDGKDDVRYRMLLRNVAGVTSATELSQSDFEDVMAVLEDSGFRQAGGAETYWRDKVSHRGTRSGERMVFKIRELAKASRYQLPALCLRVSSNRTDQEAQLYPREAWNLIELLKAANEREAARA